MACLINMWTKMTLCNKKNSSKTMVILMILLLTLAMGALTELVNNETLLKSKDITNEVVSVTKYVMSSDNNEHMVGQIRYHYYEGTNESHKHCTSILTFGVGTAMSVNDYNHLSHEIALSNPTIVVITTDSNPHDIIKTSPTKYSTLLNNIYDQLNLLIPVCGDEIMNDNNNSAPISLFLGGHSASGQAALQALQGQLFSFTPAGFIGLDPYEISSDTVDYNTPLHLPALNWGFTKTTCFVNVAKAALGAHRLFASVSDNDDPITGRVLYSIDNESNSREMAHCVFTDHGCGVGSIVVCPTIQPPKDNWALHALAQSVQLFLKAIQKGIPFTKEEFFINETNSGQVLLYVNEDDVYFVNDEYDEEGENMESEIE